MRALAVLLLVTSIASADTGVYLPNIPGYATGTQSGGGTVTRKNALDVNLASGSITLNATIGSTIGQPVPSLGIYSAANKSGTLTGELIGQQNMANSLAVVLPSDQSAIPVSQNGAWTFSGSISGATVSISGGTISLAPGSTVQLASGSNVIGSVNQAGSPWGVNLTQVGGSPISLGQVAMSSSIPVVLSNNQSTIGASIAGNPNATLSARQTITTSESVLQAPPNAVSLILECESGNSDNIRWGLSGSSSSILSSTLGMLCEPGRSAENIPVGRGAWLHMIAVGSVGTDTLDAQWVLFQ